MGRKFPNTLRVLRAERRVSQADLALVLECSQSRVSQIENGYLDPSDDEKAKLARLFKRSVSEIFPQVAA